MSMEIKIRNNIVSNYYNTFYNSQNNNFIIMSDFFS